MGSSIIKKSALKSIFSEKGFRINGVHLTKIAEILSENISHILEKVMRSARTSGRKTIRNKDIDGLISI